MPGQGVCVCLGVYRLPSQLFRRSEQVCRQLDERSRRSDGLFSRCWVINGRSPLPSFANSGDLKLCPICSSRFVAEVSERVGEGRQPAAATDDSVLQIARRGLTLFALCALPHGLHHLGADLQQAREINSSLPLALSSLQAKTRAGGWQNYVAPGRCR